MGAQQEKCDASQAFTLYHSIGGGTGSGMGTLLLLKIRDAFPDKITCSYSIYPSPKVSDTVVEPYNAVLSTHQLLENSDETFIIDNEALMNIQHNVLKVTSDADFKKINALIAKVCSGVTCPLRFQRAIDQKKCEEEVHKNEQKAKAAGTIVEWIPNNFKIGVVGTPRHDTELSATVVVNTTALKAIFQRLATQFGALFKRKAFLHWYKGEGMDEMEFQEADKNVRDLITEYQDKESAKYEEDEDGTQDESDE